MSYNAVMGMLIPAHAGGATVALILGAYNLRRRPRGDRVHRLVGRSWVLAMYWAVLSSFAIKELRPGQYSWIHGLSVFTLITLTIGLWAAVNHRPRLHRQFFTGSYLGLWGAFIGAVVVPSRDIPQWVTHRPVAFVAATAGCAIVATAVIALSRRSDRPAGATGRPAAREPCRSTQPPASRCCRP